MKCQEKATGDRKQIGCLRLVGIVVTDYWRAQGMSTMVLELWHGSHISRKIIERYILESFYLKGVEKVFCWFIFQVHRAVKPGPGRKQHSGIRVSTWVAETQLSQLSPAACQGAHYQEAGFQGNARTLTQALPYVRKASKQQHNQPLYQMSNIKNFRRHSMVLWSSHQKKTKLKECFSGFYITECSCS